MSRIEFKVHEVERIESSRGTSVIAIDVQMNEEQMYDALNSFLEHITGATWSEWLEKIEANK